jgi:hypothetical protein
MQLGVMLRRAVATIRCESCLRLMFYDVANVDQTYIVISAMRKNKMMDIDSSQSVNGQHEECG